MDVLSDFSYSSVTTFARALPAPSDGIFCPPPPSPAQLKSTEEDERFHAVSLLARMFSEQESNLAMHHRQLWLAFLGR